MLSNIKSYFTDCPHREKLGWLEQTHLIGPALLCNWDLELFYEKIEQDMADSQHLDGWYLIFVQSMSQDLINGIPALWTHRSGEVHAF